MKHHRNDPETFLIVRALLEGPAALAVMPPGSDDDDDADRRPGALPPLALRAGTIRLPQPSARAAGAFVAATVH